MAGWFRKKINTIADYKGLKIRIGPLGGKVYTKAGSTVALIPAADIYAALERGVVDACEWVGPHDDMELGLHKTARFYYYPGWHEPGSTNDFGFNKKAYDALPIDLQRTLDHATAASDLWPHDVPREERDRARATQDGVQGQGRDPPDPGAGAARPRRSWPPRSSRKSPRRRPWRRRSTRRSRSSRRWWVRGTTSPRARTIGSWRGEDRNQVAMDRTRPFA